MISIIICSRHPDISASLRENIKETIGVEYEIIAVDNSNNEYSIFSAYNKGFSQSQFPCLCFLHEDVLFKTRDWGINLINHLSDEKVGIIGIAGGKMLTNVPASWAVGGRCINILQYQKKKNKSLLIKEPHNFTGVRLSTVVLDGVFLSMRRDLLENIRFDEDIAGFHGYDYDISIQSKVAGYDNYVIYNVLLEHFSEGVKTKQYYTNLIKIFRKWQKDLPLFADDVSNNTRKNVGEIEVKNLAKLIRRLARVDFETKEIVQQAEYYATVLKTKGTYNCLKFIKLKILFERVINSFK